MTAASASAVPTNLKSPGDIFLDRAGISKEECFRIARSLSPEPDLIKPTAVQGGQSYNLQSGETIIQFRAKALEIGVLDKAREIFGNKYVLPVHCVQSEPFYVYTSPYGGLPCSTLAFRETVSAQKIAIADLALFLVRCFEYQQSEMELKFETIKQFLEDCLNLPDLREAVQSLIDNLGTPITDLL
jgi:hypothetical protein